MNKKFLSILLTLVLALSLCLVMAVPVAAAGEVWVDGIGGTLDHYATIQEGITAVESGGTVNVAAGTYEEDLVILQTLTLQGAGKTLVTVTGMLTIAASDVVVDGLKFVGTGTMGDTHEGTITIDNLGGSITEVTISNNYITGGSSGIRVGLGPNDVSKVTIEYNEIVNNPYKGALFYAAQTYAAHNVYDITIQGNVISDNGNTAISTYGLGPFTIVDNIIERNGGNGISLKYSVGDYVSGNTVIGNGAMGINMHEVTNCVVEDNTVSGHVSEVVATTFWGFEITAGKGSGIYIHELSLENTIRYNNITGNNNGVLINSEKGDLPSGNSITYNNIAGNNYYGVLNALPGTEPSIDATLNWWGNASGPAHTGDDPLGTGDAVSDNVLYEPWLAYEVGSKSEGPVTLTGNYSIPPLEIGISVSPVSVDFGDLEPGVVEAAIPPTVTVTNEGNVDENFSTTIINESTANFYTDYLYTNLECTNLVTAWTATGVVADTYKEVSLYLNVPSEIDPGTYTATLVFWAEAAQ